MTSHLDAEFFGVVKKMAHHSPNDIAEIIRQRMGLVISPSRVVEIIQEVMA